MTPHKIEMIERRARQLARKPGFVPVRNAKIEARVQATQGILTIAYQAGPGAMPNAAEIQNEAWRTVAKSLPVAPVGVRTRRFRETSKYNQSNTRGNR